MADNEKTAWNDDWLMRATVLLAQDEDARGRNEPLLDDATRAKLQAKIGERMGQTPRQPALPPDVAARSETTPESTFLRATKFMEDIPRGIQANVIGPALNAIPFVPDIVASAAGAFDKGLLGMDRSPTADFIQESRAMDPHPIANSLLGGLALGGLGAAKAGALATTGTAPLVPKLGMGLVHGGAVGGLSALVGTPLSHLANIAAGAPAESPEDIGKATLDALPFGMGLGMAAGTVGAAAGHAVDSLRNPESTLGLAYRWMEDLGGAGGGKGAGGVVQDIKQVFTGMQRPPGLKERVYDPLLRGEVPEDRAIAAARGPMAAAATGEDAASRAAAAKWNAGYEGSGEGLQKHSIAEPIKGALGMLKQQAFAPSEGGGAVPFAKNTPIVRAVQDGSNFALVDSNDVQAIRQAHPEAIVMSPEEAASMGLLEGKPNFVRIPGVRPPQQSIAGRRQQTPQPPEFDTIRDSATLPSMESGKQSLVILPKAMNAQQFEAHVRLVDTAAKADQKTVGSVPEWYKRWQQDVRAVRGKFKGNDLTANAPEAHVEISGPDGQPTTIVLPKGSYAAAKHAQGEEASSLQGRNELLGIRPGMSSSEAAAAVGQRIGGSFKEPGRQDVEKAIESVLATDPSLRPLMDGAGVRGANVWQTLAPERDIRARQLAGPLSGVTAMAKGLRYRVDPLARLLQDVAMSQAHSPSQAGASEAKRTYDQAKQAAEDARERARITSERLQGMMIRLSGPQVIPMERTP